MLDRNTIQGAMLEELQSYRVRIARLEEQRHTPEAQTPEAQAAIRGQLAELKARLARCAAVIRLHMR